MVDALLLLIAVIAFVLALVGAGRGFQVSAQMWNGQYSLRTLFVLLAVGPPLLGLGWAHREAILGAFDNADRKLSLPPPNPPQRRAARFISQRTTRTPRQALPSSKSGQLQLVEYLADLSLPTLPRDELNRIAGVGAGVFASFATTLLAAAFHRSHSWRRPPRRSPLTWSALLLAILATAAFLGFVTTLPNWQLPPAEAGEHF